MDSWDLLVEEYCQAGAERMKEIEEMRFMLFGKKVVLSFLQLLFVLNGNKFVILARRNSTAMLSRSCKDKRERSGQHCWPAAIIRRSIEFLMKATNNEKLKNKFNDLKEALRNVNSAFTTMEEANKNRNQDEQWKKFEKMLSFALKKILELDEEVQQVRNGEDVKEKWREMVLEKLKQELKNKDEHKNKKRSKRARTEKTDQSQVSPTSVEEISTTFWAQTLPIDEHQLVTNEPLAHRLFIPNTQMSELDCWQDLLPDISSANENLERIYQMENVQNLTQIVNTL